MGKLIADAMLPLLRVHGAVRMKLVENPERFQIGVLERLLEAVSSAVGFVVPQSYSEGLIAHVRDEGQDYKHHSTRGHQTRSALAFHSDRCDVNLLLYVRAARSGGELSVVSYQDAANHLRELDEQSLATLFDGFPFDLRNERIFPSLEWHWRPILWKHCGDIRGHYIRRFVIDSQRHADCPRLTRRQVHALDRFDEILEGMRQTRSFTPRPGELLVMDNYRVMHARTAYDDFEDSQGGRLALRTWVAPYDSEPLPLTLHPLAGTCTAGSYRGGVGRGEGFLLNLGKTSTTFD